MTKTVYFEYVLSGPWRKDLNQTWYVWRYHQLDQQCKVPCWLVKGFKFYAGRKLYFFLYESKVTISTALHCSTYMWCFKILVSSQCAMYFTSYLYVSSLTSFTSSATQSMIDDLPVKFDAVWIEQGFSQRRLSWDPAVTFSLGRIVSENYRAKCRRKQSGSFSIHLNVSQLIDGGRSKSTGAWSSSKGRGQTRTEGMIAVLSKACSNLIAGRNPTNLECRTQAFHGER